MSPRECGICGVTVPVTCNYCSNCGEMHEPVHDGIIVAGDDAVVL